MISLKETLTQNEINLVQSFLQKDELNIVSTQAKRYDLRDEVFQYISQRLTQNHYRIRLTDIKIKHIDIENLSSSSSTQNIKHLILNNNMIGNKGCKYLTKGKWDQLQQLTINRNHFDIFGMIHLSKARWINLKTIKMNDNFNDIGMVVRPLIKANFPNLCNLYIINSPIRSTDKSKKHFNLSEAKLIILNQWKQLQSICLYEFADTQDTHNFRNKIRSLRELFRLKLPNTAMSL